MTQEYSPDSTPARAVDDVSAMPGHYGPPTTVVTKKRRPTPRRAAPRSLAARPPMTAVGPRVLRRRPLAYLGDSRGLTFLGAVLLAAVIGTAGGVISAGKLSYVGTVFTVFFVGGCVLAALLVHREDLVTVAFMSPLLYVATVTLVGFAQAMIGKSTLLTKAKYQVGYAMTFRAYIMWWATAATAAVALIMFFVRRPAPRPVHTAPAFDPPAFDTPSADAPFTDQDPPAPYTTGVN